MKSKNVILMSLVIACLLSGCSQLRNLTQRKPQVIACATPRIDRAYDVYSQAKTKLAQHYATRNSNDLFEAYYAASDSISLARSVAKCRDKNSTHFAAFKNLTELNRELQKIVRLNMRDEDPSNLIAIYRDQYYKVMPNDIK